ncbi:MAG: F0F1 ATP synthase subunit delta [Oscillospiraceae bacterium]|nr:F0F1 ATP synthase subunit delta [Oscillospiraceae bacterium]
MTEVAKTYGDALYDLAVEEKLSTQLMEEVAVMAQAFNENPEFVKLLSTPALKKEERLSVLDNSFGGKVHAHVLNFMKILVENGTIAEFSSCADEFRRRYNKDQNIEEVTAVTAVALNDQLFAQLKQKLETMTGKTVLLQNKVDPSIIGGVRLEMEGIQLEGSVQHQLETLRRRLGQTTL